MNTQPLVPFAALGEELIRYIEDSNVLPSDAYYDRKISNMSMSLNMDYICIIDWQLNDDEKRPHKRSRPVKLVITNAALSDCQNLETAKRNLAAFISENFRHYNAKHDEVYPKEYVWEIDTLALNRK